MLHENRLIGITQAQLDAQRKAAGLTPISTAKPTSVATNPTKVASSSATGKTPTNTLLTQTDRMSAAEANANLQNIQRANTLSTKPGEVKSYIDPKTGVDTRYMVNGVDTRTLNKPLYQDFEVGKDAEGKPIYEQRLVANPGQMTQGTLYGQDVLGVQFQNTDKGVNSALNLAQQGGQTAGYTSQYAVPTMGKIDQSALKRLMDSGMSQSDALASLQGNRPDVQDAFTMQTPKSQQDFAGDKAKLRAQELENTVGYRSVTKYDANGNPYSFTEIDPQKTAELRSAAKDRFAMEDATDTANKTNAMKELGSNAAADKAATAQTSGISPEIEAALAGLPPIEAGLIRAQLQAGASEAAAGKTAALQNFADETKAADASLNAYDKVLDKAEADSKQLYEASRGIVEDSEERQKENLAREQQNALEQLAWAEQKATRDGKKALQKQIDSMVTAQALSGGYGSSNWNAEVTQAEFDGEMAIADAQQQFAFKRADVAIAYTNALNTIYDNSAVRKLEALKAYKSDLATNNQYRFSATEKTEERKVKAKQDLNNSLATIAKEQAAGIKDAIKEVRASLIQDKETKAAQETMGWNMLAKAVDVYGTNVPQAMIDSIKTKLPGVDIASVVKTPTLEQLKKLKGSGSGTGGTSARATFSVAERAADGSAPTFEQYVDSKTGFNLREYANATGTISEGAIANLQKEYDAKMASEKYLSPSALDYEWKVKSSQSGAFGSVAQMESTKENFDSAMNSKNYKLARDILDNLGSKPPEKTIAQVTSAQRVINDLTRMEQLVDRIEDNIGAFPTKGALWTWVNENIETSPEFAELAQLQSSNLAPYSRGISGDKGATTEPDVERALKSLLDPNVDPVAARAALARAKQQASESVTIYLQGMRDGGYRVKALQDTYSSGSYNTSNSDLPPEKQAFLDSF